MANRVLKDEIDSLADIANSFDKRGCTKAADLLDEMVKEAAEKKKKPGRNYAGWVRHLKKMNASHRVLDAFRKTYKEALESTKGKKKFEKADKAEDYAMKTALSKLPKKYLKEPTETNGEKANSTKE